MRTEYEYDPSTRDGKAGLVTKETDPLGRVTTYDYDALGRLAKTVRSKDAGSSASDANLTSRTFYDELGWVAATVDERGTVTREITDTQGLVTKRIEHCTDSGTTPSPSPASCIGGGDHTSKANVVTEYEYDAAGNLTKETRFGLPRGVPGDRGCHARGG